MNTVVFALVCALCTGCGGGHADENPGAAGTSLSIAPAGATATPVTLDRLTADAADNPAATDSTHSR